MCYLRSRNLNFHYYLNELQASKAQFLFIRASEFFSSAYHFRVGNVKIGHETGKLQNIDVSISFLKQKFKINKRIDGKKSKYKHPIFGSNTSYCCQKRSKDFIVFGLKQKKERQNRG